MTYNEMVLKIAKEMAEDSYIQYKKTTPILRSFTQLDPSEQEVLIERHSPLAKIAIAHMDKVYIQGFYDGANPHLDFSKQDGKDRRDMIRAGIGLIPEKEIINEF